MAYPLMVDTLEIQQGKESTWGTQVTKTVRVRGINEFTVKPGKGTERIPEKRGSAASSYLARTTEYKPEASEKGVMLYQDIVYAFESLFGAANLSGAGPYLRTYAAPLQSFPTLISYSRAHGEPGTDAAFLYGAVATKMTIKAETVGRVEYTVDWIAKTADAGFITGTMVTRNTIPEVAVAAVPATGADGTLYMDSWGGTIGTTALACTWYSYELTIDTGRSLDTMGGSLAPCAVIQPQWKGSLKLDLQVNSSTFAVEVASTDYSVVNRQFRMKFLNGTDIVQLDFAGVAEKQADLWKVRNGVATMEATFEDMYNASLGNWLKVSVTNGVSGAALV